MSWPLPLYVTQERLAAERERRERCARIISYTDRVLEELEWDFLRDAARERDADQELIDRITARQAQARAARSAGDDERTVA